MSGTVPKVETEFDGGRFRGPGTATWVSTVDQGLPSSPERVLSTETQKGWHECLWVGRPLQRTRPSFEGGWGVEGRI